MASMTIGQGFKSGKAGGGRGGLSVTSVPPYHSCQQTLSFGVLENRVRSLLSMRGQEPITSNQLLAWHVARV